MIDNDPFDELLTRSAPRATAPTPELREELTRMAVASVAERRPSGARRRLRIAAGAGIASLALFAGAGTAAATGVIEWGPWAQDPDVVYAYTLPSGEGCELRVTFDDRGTGQVARDVVSGVDLAAQLDVGASIDAMRSAPWITGDEFGNSFDSGYGTEFYPGPDEEYDIAVGHAVGDYLTLELRDRGAAVRDPALDATYASTCSIERAQ